MTSQLLQHARVVCQVGVTERCFHLIVTKLFRLDNCARKRDNRQCRKLGEAIPSRQQFGDFAKRLLTVTVINGGLPVGPNRIAFRASEKLGEPLSTLAGKAGLHALLSRALTLAKAEFPQLNPVKVDADGCLTGLNEIQPHLSAEESAEAEAALIANLLHLLSTFVGDALTLRIVHNVWPDASFNESQSGNETKA